MTPTSPTSSPAPASERIYRQKRDRLGRDRRARRDDRAGFTLIELSVALLVVALVAALALPRLMPDGGGVGTRALAYDIAAMLRADRQAAERDGRTIVTRVDAAGRRVSSGATSDTIGIPGTYRFGLANGNSAITFMPDGRSDGGLVVLGSDREGYGVAVNGPTGAVEIVRVKP